MRGRDRGLVQHGTAIGQAIGKLGALEPLGRVGGKLNRLELVLIDQFAAGDHFGQHHGDDLQVLDLFVAIDPLGAILHHQHPDRAATAQQGHTQKGVEGIFARFRSIRKVRIVWRIGQVQRTAQPHDFANQAFAGLERCRVHGLGVQALGREQFQIIGRPAQIDGAHLGNHRSGNNPHNHVQACLGRTAAGHSFADLAQ